MDWLLLQLADSAFPTGGFAHSAGLEAAWQQGEVPNAAALQSFLVDSLWQTGFSVLPLVNAAHHAPEDLLDLDRRCDIFLTNAVANRASRMQGRALLSTCGRCFPLPEIAALQRTAKEAKSCFHYAPLCGATLRALSVNLFHTQELCLFTQLRGMVSAAVRLGIVGPFEGQQLQFAAYPHVNAVLDRCGELERDELAQTAPLLDLFQATHDRLYSRLFYS